MPEKQIMEEKLYRNKDWLYRHYVVLQESTPLMAQEASCGSSTIWYWLRKFDIPIRISGEGALYRDGDWMHEHYIEMEESTHVMAQKADCGQTTIREWLCKFNISTRTLGEAIFLATRNYLNLSEELSNLLEGELLGDGCIQMHGSRSAKYTHGSKYREYLEWLSRELAGLGVEQAGGINKRWDERGNTFNYKYQSKSYPELVPMRQRWYPDGSRIKVVPKDLILTPIMARQWYLGDGGLGNRARGRPDIDFSTCDFDKPSIDHLLKELRGKGFTVSHRPSNNTIGMSVESVIDFLDYIGPCPIGCYSYKWDYQDNRKRSRRKDESQGVR